MSSHTYVCCLLLFVTPEISLTAVRLPSIFSDRMVLQVCIHLATVHVCIYFLQRLLVIVQTNSEYGARSFIFGFANPGEKITVDAPKGPYYNVADKNGRYMHMSKRVGWARPEPYMETGLAAGGRYLKVQAL